MSSNAPASTHKGHSPILFACLGIVLVLFGIYASLLQIQTSEAFILNGATTGLKPNLDVLKQVPAFIQGQLDTTMVKAVIWGWGIELLYLVCIIGYEHAHNAVRSGNSTLGSIFATGIWAIIAFNAWSDFKYGQIGTGFWGQVGFAAITAFMVAFFMVIGVKFLEIAIKEWRR